MSWAYFWSIAECRDNPSLALLTRSVITSFEGNDAEKGFQLH